MSTAQRLLSALTGMAIALATSLSNTFVLDADARASADFRLLILDGQHVKWGQPILGHGAKVTYAFAGSTLEFPGARNCSAMTSIAALLTLSRISEAAFEEEIAAAFAMWADIANVTFQKVAGPAEANIVIGAQAEPSGYAFANVAHRASATDGVSTIDKSLICLNPTKPWKIGFGGDDVIYDLRYTLAHEIGHAIGLDHPAQPSGQLMSFQYGERFRHLQLGDISGAAALYGDRDLAASSQVSRTP